MTRVLFSNWIPTILSKPERNHVVDKPQHIVTLYVCMKHIGKGQVGGELKKGSAELLILSLLSTARATDTKLANLLKPAPPAYCASMSPLSILCFTASSSGR